MAQILLQPRAPQLNTGNQTLTPVQFKIQNTGMDAALQNVGQAALSLKANLVDKTNKMDDMYSLINQSDAFEKEQLNIQKWQQENQDNPDKWEAYAQDRANNLYSNYELNPPADPEVRAHFDQKFLNWSNNIVANSFAGSIKAKSSNFMSGLNAEKDRAYQTGDFTTLDSIINQGHKDNIFSSAQVDALRQDRNNLLNRRMLDDVNNHVQTYVDNKQYDFAKDELLQAKNSKLISDSEYGAQISKIDHQFEYNNKLDSVDSKVLDNPGDVLDKLETYQTVDGSNDKSYLSFIKKMEGFEPTSKWDYAQYSVGYGTRGTMGETLTKEQAHVRLQKELLQHEQRVDTFAAQNNMQLSTNQRDALVSYDFNTGKVEGVFARANGDINQIADAIRNGIKTADGQYNQGLANRREEEAKLASLVVGADVTRSGELSWMTPEDAIKVRTKAESVLASKASDEFQTLKQAIDLGQIRGNFDNSPDRKDKPSILDALNQEQYKNLGKANDNRISVMRDSITQYANKSMINDTSLYENTRRDILSYGIKADADTSGINKVQLESKIGTMFNGAYEKELKDMLNSVTTTAEGKKSSLLLSDMITKLNTDAFEKQLFGVYKKQKQVTVPAKTPWYWWDTPEKTVDVFKKPSKIVGAGGEALKQAIVPVLEEDDAKKAEITAKVKQITDELMSGVKTGRITTKDDAKREFYHLQAQFITLSPNNVNKSSANTTTPATNTKEAIDNAWKKAQQFLPKK